VLGIVAIIASITVIGGVVLGIVAIVLGSSAAPGPRKARPPTVASP